MLKSRRSWVLAVLAVLALVVLWYLTPYYRGMFMAYRHHASGHYEVKVVGGPPLPEPQAKEFAEYAQLLEERYGVKLNIVAGCVVTDELMQYVEG